MSMKEAYEKNLQGQLDKWSAEIDQLKVKAHEAEGKAQVEYQKQIEELRSMQQAISEKLVEVKESSGDTWEDMKAGVDDAWHSLENAISSVKKRFES